MLALADAVLGAHCARFQLNLGTTPRTTSAENAGDPAHGRVSYRADDEIRTRDPHLGKVMLYQLSHIRVLRVAMIPVGVSQRTPIDRLGSVSRSWVTIGRRAAAGRH